MDDKLDKYMKGSINPDELASLKNEIEELSDEELNKIFDSRDSHMEFFESDVNNMHENLSNSIRNFRREVFLRRVFMGWAAVLVPALIICGALLFLNNKKLQNYNSFLSQQISYSTQNGEYRCLVLPDGSQINMGPKSDLSYQLNSFYEKDRVISYNGEGYFKITNNNTPFTLRMSYFEISVLGTEFSVVSRDADETSEVYLEKGSIKLSSLNQSMIMKPGETAILSKKNGSILLVNDDSYKRTAGQSVMYFKTSYIPDIVNKIKLYYGITVIGDEYFKDVSFTGSLPTNNLPQLIYILENTLKISLSYNEENNTLSFIY